MYAFLLLGFAFLQKQSIGYQKAVLKPLE